MTGKDEQSRIAALRALEESFDRHRRARFVPDGGGQAQSRPEQPIPPVQPPVPPRPRAEPHPPQVANAAPREHSAPNNPAPKSRKFRLRIPAIPGASSILVVLRSRLLRRVAYGTAAVFGVVAILCAGLWWRLGSGPIEIDLATPWLARAIEENFGGSHRVEVGGTQIERDETGHTSIRIRDILVRDADGAIVASAPKAEVAVSTSSLLTGSLRASRVSLVGAELAVRIEEDGQVTISTGAERRPLAVTPAIAKPAPTAAPDQPSRAAPAAPAPQQVLTGTEKFTELFAWIDRLGAGGLDGEGLGEIGLKNGNLTVDDLRTGKQWSFEQINFSVNRPRRGGVVFSLGSDREERPWLMTAAVVPSGFQKRSLQIEARRVLAKDILLALRLDEGQFQADVPLTGIVRAEIGPDFLPQTIEGRIVAEQGTLGNIDDPDNLVRVDKAEFTLDWDAQRRTFVMPFQIVSGSNRITLLSQFQAPQPEQNNNLWRVTITGGALVLTAGQNESDPLVLSRVLVRAHLDPRAKRLVIDQGEIGGKDMSLALSGNLDYSGTEPRLTGGMAATQMSGLSAKRIWPAFVAPTVRNWVLDHFEGGTVERIVIAANAPADTLKESGPPIPDEGLSVEVVVTNGSIRPINTLPAIKEADITTRITGRTATVSVGRGTVELDSGRKLTLTNGLFEIPDTFPKGPPAKVRFRVDGPVQAAAELLAMEPLRDAASGTQFDPATSRGTVSGQVSLAMPISKNQPEGSTSYTVNLDLTNFAADKMMMGQKLEAQTLRVIANNQGYQIKGDVKMNGTAAALDYRKAKTEPDAEVRLNTTLDDAARNRLGFDTTGMLSGPVPVKITGRMADDKDAKLTVDADLTQAKIDNLLPSWIKAPGKQARASFTLASAGKGSAKRFEDIVIDGAGTQVKGNIELAENGDLVLASFPVFSMADGDKTSLRAERGPDGTTKVTLRGDLFDGRGFVKGVLGNNPNEQKSKKHQLDDIDVDVKLGAVVGFNGETLRAVDLKMSKRNGTIRGLTLNSKIGRDTPLMADMRGRNDQRSGKQVIYLETGDAGALFRFTDMYPRMSGGQMWVALDPPTKEQTPQEGILNIRDFAVRGEAALDRIAAQNQNGAKNNGVDFSRLRVDFVRGQGRVSFRDGVVRGPAIGATMDGSIDYVKNDVHMRGTFVPLYGLNNAFGQIPIVGLFLGGSNEGLLGVTYEVVGPPGSPTLRVNPISAVAPGLLRKFFEFPGERVPDQGSNAINRSDRP